MSPARRSTARLLLAATAVVAPLLVLAGPAVASPAAAVNFACQASSPLGPVDATFSQDLTATAPATVAPGGEVSAVFDPAPNKVPDKVGNYTLREIKNFVLTVPVPANSTYVSATLSGGSGVGTPTITKVGNNLEVKLSAALKGGADFEIPTITVKLTAGASGTIETKLGGSSFADPGLTFIATAVALGFPVDAPTKCYPNPNPALTTTTIG
ncbi:MULTISPECIES: cyclase [unclassified Crossiella]|uniref:cyclase n=1 Tax=unclassified Crossiella TaxID=2620835 RepID=UPI001FFF0409|nr:MULTISPECIES: cyclase [unclassified Crossiella]MCK2241072.1 cyclase [Crossiella sp. S99.2]MCK2253784.1 cyclase [Crossiella sp. S99.1]